MVPCWEEQNQVMNNPFKNRPMFFLFVSARVQLSTHHSANPLD